MKNVSQKRNPSEKTLKLGNVFVRITLSHFGFLNGCLDWIHLDGNEIRVMFSEWMKRVTTQGVTRRQFHTQKVSVFKNGFFDWARQPWLRFILIKEKRWKVAMLVVIFIRDFISMLVSDYFEALIIILKLDNHLYILGNI